MNLTDTVNLLIRTCRDGEEGFRACAGALPAGELRATLERHAGECAQAADELKTVLARHGAEPQDATSLPGALHRGWVIATGALSGGSEHAILAECERGEDVALRDYHIALEQDLPADVRQVIEHQLEGVRRNHDQVKALRDARRGARAANEAIASPGHGRRQSLDAGRSGATGRVLQWSLAQARLHPVRALGVLLLLAGAIVGYRARSHRSQALGDWLRRLHI